MPENDQVLRISDFSGGINRKSSRLLKRLNELELLKNVDLTNIGSMKRRFGYFKRGGGVTTSTSTSSTSTSTTA